MSKPKLALIPSGYKSGKVYSILPNDATGDFDFTRQSIGTRVRKDGLIEEAKTVGSITNLQPRSEEFDNSVWIKTRTTITADQELAPNGTNTADKLTGDGTGTSYVYDALNFTTSQKYTISIYVKPINVTTFSIQKFAGGTGVAFFDLSTGTISSAPTGTMSNPIIESLSNGWFRCSAEHIPNATGSQNYGFGMQIYNGDQFYIWGAMVSEGALSDYIKTEGSQVTKRVETFTDVPRLDWLNSNCPSLLLEPQRSNILKRSEQFDNATWSKNNSSINSNSIISPNGTLTADKFIEDNTTNTHRLNQIFFSASNDTYTFSVFVKKNGRSNFHLSISDSATGQANILVDLDNGTFTNGVKPTGSWTNVSGGIEELASGWYRVHVTGDKNAGSNIIADLELYNNARNYTGDGISGIYVWGAMLEQASYPTSYIKTEASAVTRLKDECLNGGDSDLFNITEGTFFVDANNFGTPLNDYSMITLSDGGNNFIRLIYESTRIRVTIYNGATQNDQFITGVNDNERNKIAITFKENEFKAYLNGVLKYTDTSGVVPTGFDKLDFANQYGTARNFEGKVYDTRVYDRVLTEAEAIEITTL